MCYDALVLHILGHSLLKPAQSIQAFSLVNWSRENEVKKPSTAIKKRKQTKYQLCQLSFWDKARYIPISKYQKKKGNLILVTIASVVSGFNMRNFFE